MLKTRKNNVIISILFVFAILTVAIAFILIGGFANADGVSAPLKSEYRVGETVVIPEKILHSEGQDGTGVATVISPSGAAYKTSKIILNEAGKYTVEYNCVINGKTVKETEYFNVYSQMFSFTGDKSSASYGLDDSQYDTGKTALNVKLAQGEKMNFNKIIDLKELKGESFINFFVTPERRGTAEVQGIYFVLTDIYDPDNKITFQFKNVAYLGSSYVYSCSYVTAGHGNEMPRAYTYDTSDRVWRLRINDKFGTGAYLSLYGWAEEYGGYAIKDSFCQFGIDLDSKKAYVTDPKTEKAEIIDMDNPAFFDNLWEGFTTGEVMLSVEAYDYTGSTFHLNITDLYGYDFSSGTNVIDNDPPALTINDAGYDLDNLPNGYVGYSYPVFDASAFDKMYGAVDVDVKTYYGYDSDVMVEINNDGEKVSTDFEGKYEIVYTAEDNFKNVAEKTVKFFVQRNPNPINIELSSGYSTTVKVGETATLPIESVSGGSGYLSTEISIDKNGIINFDEHTFIPYETGTATVTYTVEDMTGYSQSKSYVLTVLANENPVVTDNIVIPDYLYGGLSYQFQSVTAHDFNTGRDIVADVFVDGVKCEKNIYTPVDEAGETIGDAKTVTVQYKANGSVVYSKDITVLDVIYKKGPTKNFDVSGYWIAKDLSKELTSNGLIFSKQNASFSKTEINLSKIILSDSFGLYMSLTDFSNVCNKVTVKLTDVTDMNNALAIELLNNKTDKTTDLWVNGEKTPYTINVGGFYQNDLFNLSLQNGYLKDSGAVNYNISNHFIAEKIYVSIILDGVNSGSNVELIVKQLCSLMNVDSSVRQDRIAPIVITCGEYAKKGYKGDALEIYPVVAEDLLDTSLTMKVTVTLKKPDKSNVTLLQDADASVAHTVELSDFGDCIISYSIADSAGQVRNPSYKIQVVNTVEPVITLNGEVSKTYKVGETIEFPTATAIDDLEGELEVKYFVVTPAIMPTLLKDRKFTPTYAGNYKFRVYAVDSFGNIKIVDKSFKVVD